VRRFGRELAVERLRQEQSLTGFYFDCLYLNGEEIILNGVEVLGASLVLLGLETLARPVVDNPLDLCDPANLLKH
jgi:hypothetical protein